MRGWALRTGLGFLLFSAPLAAEAQQPGNVARIGFIWSSSPSTVTGFTEAFRQGLRELGYVEGQNIALEQRWAEGRLERLPDFATEMVRSKVDIIMVGSVPAALAAKQATPTIPIVMVGVGEVLETGLVASLAHGAPRRADHSWGRADLL